MERSCRLETPLGPVILTGDSSALSSLESTSTASSAFFNGAAARLESCSSR